MADPREVEMLRKRDLAKYGNPDGPTFEHLLSKAKDAGLTDDESHMQVLASSSNTDEATNRKLTR